MCGVSLTLLRRRTAAALDPLRLRFFDYRVRCQQQSWRSGFAYAGQARTLAAHGDGTNFVAVGCATGVVSALDVRTGLLVSSARVHDAEVTRVRTLAPMPCDEAGSRDAHIRAPPLLRARTGRQIHFLDSDAAVSAAVDGTLVHWDAQRISVRSIYRGASLSRSSRRPRTTGAANPHGAAVRASGRRLRAGLGEAVDLDFNSNQVLSLLAGGGSLWRATLEKQQLSKPQVFRLKSPQWKHAPTAVATLPLHGLTLLATDDGAVHLTL